jgi:hypothetical protein
MFFFIFMFFGDNGHFSHVFGLTVDAAARVYFRVTADHQLSY